MKEEAPQRRKVLPGPSRPQQPSRKLSFSSRVRERFRRNIDRVLGADLAWSAAFVVVVVLSLAAQRWGQVYEEPDFGHVAAQDVRARHDFDYLDEALTLERRVVAGEDVPDVYTYDIGRGKRLSGQLGSLFEQGRSELEAAVQAEADVAQAVTAALESRIPAEALPILIAERFDPGLERALTSSLEEVMQDKILSNKALLERGSAITLTLTSSDGSGQRVESFDEFIDLPEARTTVRQALGRRLELPRNDEQALGDFMASFVDANVYYEREATNRDRQDAERAVTPVYMRVSRGDLLVRKGERITAEHIAKLQHANRDTRGEMGLRELIGLGALAALLAFFIHRYTRYHQRHFRKLKHLHALMVLMILSTLVLSRAMLWLTWKIVEDLKAPFNQLEAYSYLIPLGAGAILVSLLANGRIATVFSAFVALLFGAAVGWSGPLMMWALVVQCAGVYAIATYRERAALLRAGMVVGGTGAIAAVALGTLSDTPATWTQGLLAASLAFVGGALGVGLIISFSLPLLENLFKVLTDVRLLELSNVNNPLLSELALKAPGSYNHSLVVGTLAEEAAKAIGANSLFCRVAAFYHDIGKMNKPEYYVENQRGVNPHDRLSPSMSALIIASHVKDGIKMAREAGLPEQIVDIIPQHHGTKLMTYFYEKARKTADPSMGPVKEEDFRYPGPKPQTREAAIFMLSDAVEAAARTVDDPTANRLKEMIRKVTNSIVLGRELDACDMTFRDLDKIQEAFLRTLVSMYHHRVDYPGFDFSKKAEGKGELRAAPKPAGEVRDRKIARSS